MSQADTLPGELAEIKERLGRGDARFVSLEAGQAELGRQVAENTQLTRENTTITREIKELLEAGKLGFKVARGIGSFIKWAGGIAVAIGGLWALIHGGPK